MTPGGRVQAAIEILDAILAPPAGRERAPAHAVVAGYTRKRRYIGSKDRRAITGQVWQALRYRGRALWASGRERLSGRELAVAALAGAAGLSDADMDSRFGGSAYGPQGLNASERALAAAVRAASGPPPWAVANMPDWLAAEAEPVLGHAGPAGWQALAEEVPATLRVNTLKADRDSCLAALRDAGVDAAPTALSPLGIRLQSRANLARLPAMRDGWLESQDEGSQIVAALAAAGPGMQVLDYCAGGGGKALALAAAMANEGRIVATDTDAGRLASLPRRAARAGATIIECREIAPGEIVEPSAFDRVLVDAPCSGSGAWRRQPEAPWRLDRARYAEQQAAQSEILAAAAPSVAPGGRLVYATCSLFPAENDAIVERFLRADASFRPVPAGDLWRAILGTEPPAGAIDGNAARLLPHSASTDGFFVAAMERARP
ncbi:MAG: RsmB/NOP family class I SAM-dependent RNA methyltransferase [Rhodospirillaceae bacterium]|nr:RsmB/NOP family class I SAM-dependent RNA methyltransferase [Rhodospirillaceae bacterium]MYB12571.1 RsmB/NOP family class I SAM-dependent RNA methyltransferase [Rhodospirillaceae bacterium]MYI48442.1 RsmB/NOP family class I SAM-dependent RNA methyltransferase [Rhodospirillaceae bacterium]